MASGCEHYHRRCKIRAPCCNRVFGCRHCHDEAMGGWHELDRFSVTHVICSDCHIEQPVAQFCWNCEVCMGRYFCGVCNFYDDDTSKGHFHCNECGICRVGDSENFYHCKKCGCCYSTDLRNNHICVENSMMADCDICHEHLFDSLKKTTVMKCGHTLHSECHYAQIRNFTYCSEECSDAWAVYPRRSFTLEFDGASRGNPGRAGAGAFLKSDDGRLTCVLRQGLGYATNNVAEYSALILGLRFAFESGFKNVRARGDSLLVVNQMNGHWKVKHPELSRLCNEAKVLMGAIPYCKITYIERDLNTEADKQANLAVYLNEDEMQVEVVE